MGASALAFLTLGVVAILVGTAGASVTPPSAVNELVSVSGLPSDTSCPVGITPTVGSYTNLPAAIAAAAAGNTIYVCAGAYDLSNATMYSASEQVVVNKALTIDGTDWNSPYADTDTDAAVNTGDQSVIENGAGFLVQHANVTIQGFTFDANNFNNATPDCFTGSTSFACSSSIDVQSNVNTPTAGDQGENNVTIADDLFADTGGADHQNGVVHFGLGKNGPAADVTALDAGDVVNDNVFYQGAGFPNNAVQISDTDVAVVESNTVNYPVVTDAELTALLFPGFDQSTQVAVNTLNGGRIDSDLSSGITAGTKVGIEFVDSDAGGNYGDGCSEQSIANNTISGFVSDIAIISTGYDTDGESLCPGGPTDFSVTHNSLDTARLYGIYLSGTTGGSITANTTNHTDTEGYAPDGYIAGEYDYYDAWGDATHNQWGNGANGGDGSTYPSAIGEGSTAPPTTMPPTTMTTMPPATTIATIPPTTATTTPTTLAPNPSVSTSGATLKAGNKVATTVRCANATCSGTLELTKTVTTKIEIGHTKKYRTKSVVENLGKTRYSVAAGGKRSFSVTVNATGLRLMRAAKGRRYSCELVITSSAGTKREAISFKRP
jgi:hypothetical protein